MPNVTSSPYGMAGQWGGLWGQRPEGLGQMSAQSYFQQNPNMIGSYYQGHGGLSGFLRSQYPNWFNHQVGGAGTPRPNNPYNPNNPAMPNPSTPSDNYGGDTPNVYNPNPNPNTYAPQTMARPSFGNGNPPVNDAIPTAPIIQTPKYPTNPSMWGNGTPNDNYVAPPRPVQQPYVFNPSSPTFHANRGNGGIGGFRSGGWF